MPTCCRSLLTSTPGPETRSFVQADLAALDRIQPVDAAEQGGLAAARRADQANHLVLVDREVEAAQHRVLAVALVDIAHLQEGHGSASAPGPDAPVVALDQLIDEARLRDGDQHEQDRDDGDRRRG